MSDSTRILVIDDDQAVHADFQKILCPTTQSNDLRDVESALFGKAKAVAPSPGLCVHVDHALQGKQGYDLLCAAMDVGRPYAVAFVDMRMPPGWDGLETIENLWKADPRLQVVICTAFSDYSWEEVAARLGRTDNLLILKKPVDPAEVRQMALSLTAKWNLHEQVMKRLRQSETLSHDLFESNQQLQQEIGDRRAAEEQLRKQTTRDQLTGLVNRRHLVDRIRRCIERQRQEPGSRYAVMFLDLDNFKLVNDSFGHTLGDELLVRVSRRLRDCLVELGVQSRDEHEAIARIGGDEFVIVVEDPKRALDYAEIAQTILDRMGESFDLGWGRTSVIIGASIGVALCDDSYERAEDVLRDADTAMYRAKTAGKARFAVFDPEMHRAAKLRLQVENDLRQAISQRELRLVFQPIVKLPDGELAGFEALVRWDGGSDGGHRPDVFIPIAEESGLIIPMGRWVLETAASQLDSWRKRTPGLRGMSVSVNVSRRELMDPNFVENVRAVVTRFDLPAGALKLEVTENGIIDDFEAAASRLNELKKLGLGLYMDDFGTGYSSLSCLNRLPFDVVKIDRAFTAQLEGNGNYAAVIRAVVALARSVDMDVLVEGVETQEQLDLIIKLGCHFAQGYLFSRAVDLDQAAMMLRRGTILAPSGA